MTAESFPPCALPVRTRVARSIDSVSRTVGRMANGGRVSLLKIRQIPVSGSPYGRAGPGGIAAARLGDIEQDGAGMVTPDRDLVTTRGEVDEVFRLPGNGAGGR